MSAWLAPGGIIIEIGSPGTTRRRTKTTTATPKSVGGTRRRRRITAPFSIRSPVPSASGRLYRLRQEHTVGLRRQRDAFPRDDRLHVLEERDDLALLGNVLGHRLVAGDALGLVRFAPERADHVDEVLAVPDRMRRRAEHGKAGRGGRVADRVAPVVEGGRSQLVGGAQLVVLGDLVDLDGRVDADLPPHA